MKLTAVINWPEVVKRFISMTALCKTDGTLSIIVQPSFVYISILVQPSFVYFLTASPDDDF